MISSFEISNFRTFKHLSIPSLGQVNLIVGRNNTGKTMLLEALRLHRARGAPSVIRELLMNRDEYGRIPLMSSQGMRSARLEALFNGRQPSPGTSLWMGPLGDTEDRLEIKSLLLRPGRRRKAEFPELPEWGESVDHELDAETIKGRSFGGVAVIYGKGKQRIIRPESAQPTFLGRGYGMEIAQATDRSAFVPATGLSSDTAAAWWDSVSLTDAEERIVECLALIAPIQRLSFVESPSESGRIAVARIKGEPEPVPLRSLGDGMRRMFHFALALEAARENALLLIDELENGVHYSVHKELWRFLIQSAQRSGVQVFATTHSWDCVQGLREALEELSDVDANVIKLYRKGADVSVSVLDRNDILIAGRDGIEVR